MRGAMQMQEYSYEGGESSLELMPTSIGQEDCRPGHSFGPGERKTLCRVLPSAPAGDGQTGQALRL